MDQRKDMPIDSEPTGGPAPTRVESNERALDWQRSEQWDREASDLVSEWTAQRPGYYGRHWSSQGEISGLGNFGPPYAPGWSPAIKPSADESDATDESGDADETGEAG